MDINQSSQTNYCSNCGHPVEPGTIFCSNCGTQLDHFSDLNPKIEPRFFSHQAQEYTNHNKQRLERGKNKYSLNNKWLLLIPMGMILIILMIVISTQKPLNSKQTNSSSPITQPTIERVEPNNFSEFQPTITSVPISTEALDQMQPTAVKITPTSVENYNTSSTKPISSCPGAPDQRLTVGENARVCTKSDNVYIRKSPSRESSILTSVAPGAVVKIIGGPECANEWSYWEVEISDGTTGWISEGGDKTDRYFLCPISKTGSGSISGHLYYPSEMIPNGYVVAININTNEITYIKNKLNQYTFQIDNLPPGKYYIARYLPYERNETDPRIFVNTYTKWVDCVRSSSEAMPACYDHSLVPVEVFAGQTTEEIHLLDFILTTDYGLPENPINP